MKLKVKSVSLIAALIMITGATAFSANEITVKAETQKTKEQSVTQYKIGDRGPAGGWIFYDKKNSDGGWRYLEAAPEDQGTTKWCSDSKSITGAQGTAVGTGKSNTAAIVKSTAEEKIAAKLCTEYRGGAKSDWFLPSKDELELMEANLYKNDIKGFATYPPYWSSSETLKEVAWFVLFGTAINYRNKDDNGVVRAIRTCDNSSEQTVATYNINDKGPAGGWIFYDKGNSDDGWRYLEAAAYDQSSEAGAEGGCETKSIPGLGTAVGTGKSNTVTIVKSCGEKKIAAKLCTEFRGGGKSDWFLPSKDELNLMKRRLTKASFNDRFYWTSSDNNGLRDARGSSRVRAIRAFKHYGEPVESKESKNKLKVTTYMIGDKGPAGGWIFYDNGNTDDGWRYLEVAPVDQSPEGGAKWGCEAKKIPGAKGTAVGTGKKNTEAILKSCSEAKTAAKLCAAYRGGGKSDWFLPSIEEWRLILNNLMQIGIVKYEKYWSSSAAGSEASLAPDFFYSKRGDSYYVRAIRAFK